EAIPVALARRAVLGEEADEAMNEVVQRRRNSRSDRYLAELSPAAIELEVAVVDEGELLILLESAIVASELQGVRTFDPANCVGVLPGVVEARLRSLDRVSDR